MARRTPGGALDPSVFDSPGRHVYDTELPTELETSFLEFAVSSLTRAIPDGRDGLKPVHRRILYAAAQMLLRPDRPYVKSARIVGEVMGNYHPHGDAAIYDALVRLAQPFTLSVPLVDGHGNFGTQPGDTAAASRYTEARLSAAAMLLVGELGEQTVDELPNYDGERTEPVVLPARFPNLLVNGAEGIGVGMTTSMIPHNLGEVVAAARHLVDHPDATLDDLMAFVPGPDLPTGGLLLGQDQVRQAYETGQGVVRLRGKVEVGPLPGSRGRQAITVTELPYGVGTERVIAGISEHNGKRLTGIADVKDLSEGGATRLVIELKGGFNPQAVLADLYRVTALEESFGIRNLVMLDGRPQTLGLRDLLVVFLDHRYDVVRRRTQFRLRRAEERAHLVEGLLTALDAIDEVVRIIRGSADTGAARAALIARFALSDIQAGAILDMPLRRLVALEVEALRSELAELRERIAGLRRILAEPAVLRALVSSELAEVAGEHAASRRTTLVGGDLRELVTAAPGAPREVADDPCQVLLSATGLVARTAAESEEAVEARRRSGRVRHDVVAAVAHTTARGQVLLLTSAGRAVRADVLALPVLPEQAGTVSLRGGVPAAELAALAAGERVVGVASARTDGPGLAVGTRRGIVKRVRPAWPVRSDGFSYMGLERGDEVVGVVEAGEEAELVFVTSEGSLLRFPAAAVRPQGPAGGGMAGVALPPGAEVLAFAAVRTDDPAHGEPAVVTSTGASVKLTPLAAYPRKGRGTGGVRCHRLARGADGLVLAWVGPRPAAATERGEPLPLPAPDRRRDGPGVPAADAPAVLGHLVERT